MQVFELWLPILASGVAVHIASFVCWMVSPHHKKDWRKLPKEDEMMDKVRSGEIPTGQYIFPCIQPEELKDPEVKKRWQAGPWGIISVWKGTPNYGRNIMLTLLFFLVTSFFVGYVAMLADQPGHGFLEHFQIAGTTAIIAYCFAFIPNDIWFGTPCRMSMLKILDGIIYGLLTGVIFGALWPSA